MPINLQHPSPSVATIEVGEAIDVRNAEALEASCKQAIGDGVRHFVFDLSETVLVDSKGIGMLLSLHRRLAMVDGEVPKIVLSNVRARARTTFELTKTERLFVFAESVEEAVELLE